MVPQAPVVPDNLFLRSASRPAEIAAPPSSGTQLARGSAPAFLDGWRVGCPVCNKLVVALLGTSGALKHFAPIQPLLGVITVGLSATALIVRLRAF